MEAQLLDYPRPIHWWKGRRKIGEEIPTRPKQKKNYNLERKKTHKMEGKKILTTCEEMSDGDKKNQSIPQNTAN